MPPRTILRNATSRMVQRIVKNHFADFSSDICHLKLSDSWQTLLHSEEDAHRFVERLCSSSDVKPIIIHSQGCVAFVDISGFSSLAENLSKAYGIEGVEMLTSIINKYFSLIINITTAYGGDVIRFAGDALLVCWSLDEFSTLNLKQIAALALECCNRLVRDLANYDVGVEDATLSLHSALGCGDIVQMVAGGYDSYELVVLGKPVKQIAMGLAISMTGQTIVSPQVVQLLDLGDSDGKEVLDGFFLLNPLQVENRKDLMDSLLPVVASLLSSIASQEGKQRHRHHRIEKVEEKKEEEDGEGLKESQKANRGDYNNNNNNDDNGNDSDVDADNGDDADDSDDDSDDDGEDIDQTDVTPKKKRKRCKR